LADIQWVLKHKEILLIISWIVCLFLIFSMWFSSHRSKIQYRYISSLSLVLLNIVFIVSAVNFILRYKDHIIIAISCWLVGCLVAIIILFRRTMLAKIETESRTKLLKVPMFFYRAIFYFYLPSILIYLSIYTFDPVFIHSIFFIVLFMSFKGAIAGIYLGFTAAALLQVFDQ
jgi:hypothetical protein